VDVAVSDLHLFFYPERSEGALLLLGFSKASRGFIYVQTKFLTCS
jgi:hypothetical protein